MIAGIGVDSVEIARMGESISGATFLKRVFSAEERALFEGKKENRAAELAAGCFAAKEAFLKATGRGLGGFALSDIAVLREKSAPDAHTGRPYFALTGAAAEHMAQNGLAAHLSITHDGGMAIAFVVLEKAEG